jgi:hypothetical protein
MKSFASVEAPLTPDPAALNSFVGTEPFSPEPEGPSETELAALADALTSAEAAEPEGVRFPSSELGRNGIREWSRQRQPAQRDRECREESDIPAPAQSDWMSAKRSLTARLPRSKRPGVARSYAVNWCCRFWRRVKWRRTNRSM